MKNLNVSRNRRNEGNPLWMYDIGPTERRPLFPHEESMILHEYEDKAKRFISIVVINPPLWYPLKDPQANVENFATILTKFQLQPSHRQQNSTTKLLDIFFTTPYMDVLVESVEERIYLFSLSLSQATFVDNLKDFDPDHLFLCLYGLLS